MYTIHQNSTTKKTIFNDHPYIFSPSIQSYQFPYALANLNSSCYSLCLHFGKLSHLWPSTLSSKLLIVSSFHFTKRTFFNFPNINDFPLVLSSNSIYQKLEIYITSLMSQYNHERPPLSIYSNHTCCTYSCISIVGNTCRRSLFFTPLFS